MGKVSLGKALDDIQNEAGLKVKLEKEINALEHKVVAYVVNSDGKTICSLTDGEILNIRDYKKGRLKMANYNLKVYLNELEVE
ncbi:MAG: hypothetical protein ACRC41_16090 [Sarcina sp.]